MEENKLWNMVYDLIQLKQEGGYWDFKRQWHESKSDLLHDILCMANNLSDKDCYIIIGVDDKNDYSLVDVSMDANRRKTQNLVDFLRSKKFAGGIRPLVYVQTLDFKLAQLDVIIIKNTSATPYYLTERFENLIANNIYTRIEDTNTPINNSADRNFVEYLWKKNFGLNRSPLERVQYYLVDCKKWVSTKAQTLSMKYYKYAPEFTIEHTYLHDRNAHEFFHFGQIDSTPRWYEILIRYHQTILHNMMGVSLDGGRCFSAMPQTYLYDFSDSIDWRVSYIYFIKDSLEYAIQQYYNTKENEDKQHQYTKFMECVLVFESIYEKAEYDEYVLLNIKKLNLLANEKEQYLPCFPDLKNYNMAVFKSRYRYALAFNALLTEFRSYSDS